MKLEVREMKKEDWQEVTAIYQSGIDTNLATFQTQTPTYEEWDSAHLDVCRIVAVENDMVVGWAALSPISSRPVYAGVAEVSIYIAESHRGKGAGPLLLDTLAEQAGRAGLWTLQSGIMEDNTVSIRLHEKCGFRLVGYREKIGRDRFGTWRSTVLMEKRNKL